MYSMGRSSTQTRWALPRRLRRQWLRRWADEVLLNGVVNLRRYRSAAKINPQHKIWAPERSA